MKLLDYIKGLRKGKDAHRIELEAMQDPFLSDSLDGYDSVKGDHGNSIIRMQEQISRQFQAKKSSLRNWSVAASVIIAIGIGGYFFRMEKRPDMYSSTDLQKSETTQLPMEGVATEMKQEEFLVSETLGNKRSKQMEKDIQVQAESIQASSEVPSDQGAPKNQSVESVKVAIIDKNLALAEEKSQSSGKMVTGRIVDESGEPLIGASIIQKGTTLGAVTDLDGRFAFQATDSSSLIANYIGYSSKEIQANAQTPLIITMKPDNLALSEVVVTAYATQKKQSVTGSISSVETKRQAVKKSEPVIGNKEYKKYLKENLIYPVDSACMDKRGTVILLFTVDQGGNPVNIQVKKSICPSIDTEAIRLLNHGCRWTAGEDTVELKIKF